MKPDGGQAFPSGYKRFVLESGEPSHSEGIPGMTLRDYFAAKAMMAVVGATVRSYDIFDSDTNKRSIAAECYEMADAMLAERGK